MDDPPTQREMLQELYHAVFDDGGLKSEVGAIKCALIGSINGREGLIFRFNDHIEQHKQERRRMIAILTTAATGIGALVSWVLDYFFHK